MRSLLNVALICAATLGSVTVAEAMPAAFVPAPSASASVGGAQLDKVVVIVRKKIIVRRPRRVVKRVIIR